MNFRFILSIFNRILIVKQSVEHRSIHHCQNFIDNMKIYAYNYNNFTYSERFMVHSMINLLN